MAHRWFILSLDFVELCSTGWRGGKNTKTRHHRWIKKIQPFVAVIGQIIQVSTLNISLYGQRMDSMFFVVVVVFPSTPPCPAHREWLTHTQPLREWMLVGMMWICFDSTGVILPMINVQIMKHDINKRFYIKTPFRNLQHSGRVWNI